MPFEKSRQPEVTDYEKMSEEDLTQALYRRLDVITGRVLLTGDWKGEDTALSRVFMPEKGGVYKEKTIAAFANVLEVFSFAAKAQQPPETTSSNEFLKNLHDGNRGIFIDIAEVLAKVLDEALMKPRLTIETIKVFDAEISSFRDLHFAEEFDATRDALRAAKALKNILNNLLRLKSVK